MHPADPTTQPGTIEVDVSALITDDGAPVDNVLSERNMRLLTEALYTSWRPVGVDGQPRPFFASANVGLFVVNRNPAIVPDVLVSLDTSMPEGRSLEDVKSYFVWEFGKLPDIVVEIVSNREGEELGEKRHKYARLRIPYYVVYDPAGHLGETRLHVLRNAGDLYVPHREQTFPGLGLGVTLWTGEFQGCAGTFLRWTDERGGLLLTGAERAESERERAERLAARLRALGLDDA